MNYLVISDIHGAAQQLDLLSRRETQYDAVLMNGDLTHFGGRREAEPLLETLLGFSSALAAVHGNCDKPDVAQLLAERGVGGDGRFIGTVPHPVLALGGSLPAPIPTPSTWSEEEAGAILDTIDPPGEPWIFLCHQPPFESDGDRIQSGKHVGSAAVAEFIRRTRPALVCSGHIHEAFSISRFGDSLLVNPGSLKDGRYALVAFGEEGVSAELRTL